MTFLSREAQLKDIQAMQVVRHAVKENTLSDPLLVTDKDCKLYIQQRGKGWVCEAANKLVAFAIADLQDNNIWALFVLPEYENMGIGKQLHKTMLDWYFAQGKDKVWLSTWPGTRAEIFYTKQGWTKTGFLKNGEVKMELTAATWLK